MFITLLALAWLGLAFGSFVNALVWRVKHQQSIAHGRSRCVHCLHQLSAKDLVPVFSWLMLRGRCRYCGKPIAKQYPIIELAGGLIFVVSYLFWPGGLHNTGDWVPLVFWLAVSVGLLALLVYDWKWMLLPNKILYPTLALAVAGRLIYLISFEDSKLIALTEWALSLTVASGIFWLLFMASKGKWIGYGDVRLGLITGTVLASPDKSLMMIFLASMLGTIFVMPSLVTGRKELADKLPYGPFLIIATAVTLLFSSSILDSYNRFLQP